MSGKKKPIICAAAALAAAGVIAAAVWGRQYYNDRYVGADYYARVPADYDVTPETLYSDSGEDVGLGKVYSLTAYDPQGEPRTAEFIVHADRSALPQPGAYLYIGASRQIVLSWSLINEGDIPPAALEKLKAGD
ncbi:MAG: DUF1093 domain-containing protein [Oscillospiraceae bacterium]|nr:DUF1093 domain-containing protein [Oscillospiraceae bacterium]